MKSLSDVGKTKIKKAKEVRENLGGENNHLLQCEGVPEEFNDNLHGVRSEPCYKKEGKQDSFYFYHYLRKSCLILLDSNTFLIEKLSALQYTVYIQKKKRLRTTLDLFAFSRGFLRRSLYSLTFSVPNLNQ